MNSHLSAFRLSTSCLRPQRVRCGTLLAGAALALCLAGCPGNDSKLGPMTAEPQRLREVTIEVKGKRVTVEVAETPEQKAKGLMFRDSLPEDHGMLFIYSEEAMMKYYMLHVRFPISIAFISREGAIEQIEKMQPREEMPIYSRKPVMYVLEMSQDWFDRHGVVVGDKIKLEL